MVKITTIFVASLAAFAPIAEAKDRHCVQGLTYCGYILLRRGSEAGLETKTAGSDCLSNSRQLLQPDRHGAHEDLSGSCSQQPY